MAMERMNVKRKRAQRREDRGREKKCKEEVCVAKSSGRCEISLERLSIQVLWELVAALLLPTCLLLRVWNDFFSALMNEYTSSLEPPFDRRETSNSDELFSDSSDTP